CKTEAPAAPGCGDKHVDTGEQCDDGNQMNGDGCSATCQNEPAPSSTEIVCQQLAPLANGTCEVTAGDANRLVVGTVLTPTKIYRGGQVLVDDTGTIAFVGCKADCDADATCKARAMTATAITCPQGVVSPGLVNTHDHLTFTQTSPRKNPTAERWEHRHEWRV